MAFRCGRNAPRRESKGAHEMAFVRILLMNLLFCGPLRVFFGAPAGAVFGFLFCAAGALCRRR